MDDVGTELLLTSNTMQPLHPDCLNHRVRLAECLGASPFDRQTFTIWQCETCGLGFTDPIPTSESAGLLYQTRESNDFQPGDNGLVARLKIAAAMRDVRAFCRGFSMPVQPKILDFSCGNGMFAYAMQRLYRDAFVVGSDNHADPPEGMSIRYLPNSRLGECRGTFDLILCRHVLEHTYDPISLLTFLREMLAPGGVLAIEVPSLETPLARVFGKFWDGYYAPYHTVHFTRPSLASIVQASGLKILRQGSAEMPKIGRSIRNILGCRYNSVLFTIGMLLHPLQVAIGAISHRPVCLRLWAINEETKVS